MYEGLQALRTLLLRRIKLLQTSSHTLYMQESDDKMITPRGSVVAQQNVRYA
jgi:hypothetical protein